MTSGDVMNEHDEGALTQAIKTLTETVAAMDKRLSNLESTIQTGRGVLIAIAAVVGLFVTDVVRAIKSMLAGAA
jgi:hypothetical protein